MRQRQLVKQPMFVPVGKGGQGAIGTLIRTDRAIATEQPRVLHH